MGGGDLQVRVSVIGGGGASSLDARGGAGGAAELGRVAARSSSAADVEIWADVHGGVGGAGGAASPGGDGASVALADVVEGETAGMLVLRQLAYAGDAGSSKGGEAPLAGNALSHLDQSASASSLFLDARAFGGTGGSLAATSGNAGRGGDADARSVAYNDAGSAWANARADAGAGGFGSGGATTGASGDAIAYASARTAGDGHSVFVGDLTPFSSLTGARGSNASSESHGEALGNSEVRVFDHAQAGAGTAEAAAGGKASSTAVGRNAGDEQVEVFAEARGGEGASALYLPTLERGGDGGEARLGTVYGASSGGGDVSVGAIAVGGSGGQGDPDGGRLGGDGASVALFNAVDGDTPGRLSLFQEADGGGGGTGGLDGETSSILDVSKSLSALELVGIARGAKDAEARASGVNDAGGVSVHNFAYAGTGVGRDRAGNALARTFGRTVGAGHDISVDGECGVCGYAVGGSGGDRAGDGRGGDADSESVGEALGDSAVVVEDQAYAGWGASADSLLDVPGGGGAARSSARAIGHGASAVSAAARAEGGYGGRPDSGGPANGGDAMALSEAEGLGEVHSIALATAGRGGHFPNEWVASGTALARASGIGASGDARSDAEVSGFALWSLRASAVAPIASRATAESRASMLDPIAAGAPAGADAWALATGLPRAADVASLIAGSARVADAFASDSIDLVLMSGQAGLTSAHSAEGGAQPVTSAFEILANSHQVSVLDEGILVGFLNPEFTGDFGSLRFRATLGQESLVDVSFADVDAALAYFDDRVIALASFPDDPFGLANRLGAEPELRLDRSRDGPVALRRRPDRRPHADPRALDGAAPRPRPRLHGRARTPPPRRDMIGR